LLIVSFPWTPVRIRTGPNASTDPLTAIVEYPGIPMPDQAIQLVPAALLETLMKPLNAVALCGDRY